jgi:hypothetical protein
MNVTLLPIPLLRGSAIILLAVGIFIVAVHAVLVAVAAQRSALRPHVHVMAPLFVGAFLAVWLGVAIATGDGSNFPLSRNDFRPPVSLVVAFGPMLVAMALLFSSKTMRALNSAMPPAWLIWVQTYRVAGLLFLYPFLYYGVLPTGFAVPAAAGDFLTGLLAPLVGLAVAKRRPNALAWATAWNIFGVLDLIVAPIAAVLSHTQVLSLYPLALVPLFVGPPLGILTHVYSLRNLATAARSDVAGSPLSPAGAKRPGRIEERFVKDK